MCVFSNRAFLAGLQNLLRILYQAGYKDTSTRVKMPVAIHQMQMKFHPGRKIEKMSMQFMQMRTQTLMMGESPLSLLAVTQKVNSVGVWLQSRDHFLNLNYLYIT